MYNNNKKREFKVSIFKLNMNTKSFKDPKHLEDAEAILESIPFEKISVPVQIKRSLLEKDNHSDKLMQIGYVRSYSTEVDNDVFTISIFGKYIDAFTDLYNSNPTTMEIQYVEDKLNALKCITKLVVNTL